MNHIPDNLNSMTISAKEHNLNLQSYTYHELMDIFGLSINNKITFDDMKRVKMKVLKMHPDKSKLPAEYFLFFKKAFSIIIELYETQDRINQSILRSNSKEPLEYDPHQVPQQKNKQLQKNISQQITNMDKDEFNSNFNKLFDQHSIRKNSAEDVIRKNSWFTEENNPQHIANTGDVNSRIQHMKQKQKENQLIQHKDIQSLYASSSANIGNLYEDVEDDLTDEYVSCDPFNKLKFDDIRRVHKDQTIFSVSESDLVSPKYKNLEEYRNFRDKQILKPMDKTQSENSISKQELIYQQTILKKEYDAKLRSMQNEEKGKAMLAQFLLLK
jgi:hypothetical protein